MLVRVKRIAGVRQAAQRRVVRGASIALAAALAVVSTAAFAQTSPQGGAGAPAGSPPPGYAQPSSSPGPADAPNSPPAAYPPPGYPPQSGYPPNQAQQGQPPPAQQPNYGQQPGFGAYSEPPLPPPPKRNELAWSMRFQVLDLLFGRATGEVEYAFAGPFSAVIIPEYIFFSPAQDRTSGVTAKGAGIAAELGYWLEGRPLRGYFLKAHGGYRSIKFSSAIQEVSVPATQVGAMFGSQSIYGGWFTLSGGFGVVYDFQSQDRPIVTGYDSTGRPVGYIIGASGLFGNGFDLLGQLSIGGSF
jgi:hypothetical protein